MTPTERVAEARRVVQRWRVQLSHSRPYSARRGWLESKLEAALGELEAAEAAEIAAASVAP